MSDGSRLDSVLHSLSFFRVLIEGNEQRYRLDFKERTSAVGCDRAIYVLGAQPAHDLKLQQHSSASLKERLHRWTRGGQYGFLFDNAEDTLSFSRFRRLTSTVGMTPPEVLEPLLFYVLHRASNEITDPKKLGTSKFSCSTRRGSLSRMRRFAIMWCRRRKHGASTERR